MTPDIDALKGLSLDEIENTLALLTSHRQTNLLDFYEPYPKQKEFFALGFDHNERLLTAGNQVGKSDAGAEETAHHLTGRYPKWWEGRRWERPVNGWAASESTTVGRDVAQTKLCGKPNVADALGTGFIPRECFQGHPTLARGAVAGAYDTINVYHETNGVRDGVSSLGFKSYEQGRSKFQGPTLDFVWWDEEPNEEIYTEGNARWSATGGCSWMTFTPLLGPTRVVNRFVRGTDDEGNRLPNVAYVRMSVHDAKHMTPERIADLRAKYPKHTWPARIDGFPLLGEGAIFSTPEGFITFPAGKVIPAHWSKLWGIDFGITHPFAAVLGAWDRDEDVIYLCTGYRAANALPIIHCEAIRRICGAAPIAWPHDGHSREKSSGEAIMREYRDVGAGLRFLSTHATFQGGGFSTEAAVLEMDQREADGRLKVREDMADYLEERRLYHRKDGLIVKVNDDLLSAAQKIIMQKRSGRAVEFGSVARPDKERIARLRRQPRPAINPWTGRVDRPHM